MQKRIGILIWLLFPLAGLPAQETGTYYFQDWSRYQYSGEDSLAAFQGLKPYYAVTYDSGRVQRAAYYSKTDSLIRQIDYIYQNRTVYVGETLKNGLGDKLLETSYREQPEDENLTQKVYGPDFVMRADHFFSRRYFDQQGREIRYELFAVNGERIAYIETKFDSTGRKQSVITTDDVHQHPIEKLVYSYSGAGRYILETYDQAGQLKSRMTLFDGNKLLTP